MKKKIQTQKSFHEKNHYEFLHLKSPWGRFVKPRIPLNSVWPALVDGVTDDAVELVVCVQEHELIAAACK